MPTPVTAARQCLTQEPSAALDHAVALARRRGHPQTTSLHMVASLLALPNSSLREACTRARNTAYSTRARFRALELSLGVYLDRLPSAKVPKIEEPPVSNSLMAAIKRSQANQRRLPEGFGYHLLQHSSSSSSSSSSIPIVKVELQNLILSILDDPLISRVFGDSGFRNCDVKMATFRKRGGINDFRSRYLYGYASMYEWQNKNQNRPSFSCHSSKHSDKKIEFGSASYSRFPFMGCYDEVSRRIGEVMLRSKKRNPLLVGASAGDVLMTFLKTLESKIEGVLPVGLSGLSVVRVEDEVLRFVNEDHDEGSLRSRFEEVEKLLGNVVGRRVVVSLGDLKALLVGDGVGFDGLRCLVGKVAKLLEDHGGKVWLIGAADNDEVYSRILNYFPSIEEEWNLEILPITSLKFTMGAPYRGSSLMENFVPLGGFFSMPSDMKSSLNRASQYVSRCHTCNEKYNQEISSLSNDRLYSPVAEPYQPGWPSHPQLNKPSGFATIKAKEDCMSPNARIAGLQKKWDTICCQHHGNNQPGQLGYQCPRVLRFQNSEDKSASITDGHTSPNSVISVSTDLNLGIISSSSSRELVDISNGDLIQDLSGLLSTNDDAVKSIISNCSSRSHDNLTHSSPKELENLYGALLEEVGHQQETISSVIEAITKCQTRTLRFNGTSHGDIWISLQGPDTLGKKKLGLALAKILYGSTECFVYVDLSFPDETTHADKVFYSLVRNKYDLTMRGTVVDYLVEKLSIKPCIVFLDNVDKSDHVVQNQLSRAIITGRFTDSRGREVNVSNSLFLATTRFMEGSKNHLRGKSLEKFSEENVLKARGHPIQISVRFDLNDDRMGENMCRLDDAKQGGTSEPVLMNKRKIIVTDQCKSSEVTKKSHKVSNSYLDLNRPAQTSEICETCFSGSDLDSSSENSRLWMKDFDRQNDRTVVFKALDFDTLADKFLKGMSECLCDTVGSKCSLEIEFRVMQQILNAAYLFGNKSVEDWILQVVREGFLEAVDKFGLNDRSIVKLVPCESSLDEQHIEGHLLPGRIIMN